MDLNEILKNISSTDNEDVKNYIKMIPEFSHISYINYDDEYQTGGYLISCHKTYIKLITKLDDIDSIIKLKYKDVKKLYYVYNIRSYRRNYIRENKDKKAAQNRRYYEKKKLKNIDKELMLN